MPGPASTAECQTPRIRAIDATSSQEIDLVAARMRDTLVEVEGEANADRLHSPAWIRERLLWHVASPEVLAKVYVATLPNQEIVGHTVLRREIDEEGNQYGLVSTTYVLPIHRRSGIAKQLLTAGEEWFASVGLSTFSTWTSATNVKLIELYERNGYGITESGVNEVTGTAMVKLTRSVQRSPNAA